MRGHLGGQRGCWPRLLLRTLVANGTKRHFAAAQQAVAIGGKVSL